MGWFCRGVVVGKASFVKLLSYLVTVVVPFVIRRVSWYLRLVGSVKVPCDYGRGSVFGAGE